MARGKTPSEIPEPSDYDVMEDYEQKKSDYELEMREFKRLEKLALQTYPEENRKVYSSLVDCISIASMQELKRTERGAAIHADHDAYSLFKFAIEEHEFLPPTISSAAVARAKADFEGLRQSASDSIVEHINEFKRRLEVYLKARGADEKSPYLDFDMRDLLIRSLYKPTWATWIATREDNDNMPSSFEGLEVALKKQETMMILRAPARPLDMHMPAAHPTISVSHSTKEKATGPDQLQLLWPVFRSQETVAHAMQYLPGAIQEQSP